SIDGTFSLKNADIRGGDQAVHAAGYVTGSITASEFVNNKDNQVVRLLDGDWTIGGTDPADAVIFDNNIGGALYLTTKGMPLHVEVIGTTFVENYRRGEAQDGVAGAI